MGMNKVFWYLGEALIIINLSAIDWLYFFPGVGPFHLVTIGGIYDIVNNLVYSLVFSVLFLFLYLGAKALYFHFTHTFIHPRKDRPS